MTQSNAKDVEKNYRHHRGHGLRRVRRYNAKMFSSSSRLLISLIASCLFIALSAAAQQSPPAQPRQVSTDTPAPRPAAEPPLPPHAFWDRTNILLFTGVGVFRGLDYVSTRNFQARGREEVLIPDDVVNNSVGFAALEAAGTATSIGLSYWMHRIGHHNIEPWISIVHIGVTGFGVARNYSLKSKHAAP
jgi:hypothetical protein